MQGHAGPLPTAIRWVEPERHDLGVTVRPAYVVPVRVTTMLAQGKRDVRGTAAQPPTNACQAGDFPPRASCGGALPAAARRRGREAAYAGDLATIRAIKECARP